MAQVTRAHHAVYARRFLWSGLLFLAFGGALAMLIRWQWAFPGAPLPLLGPLTPSSYQRVFTLHGLVMIFFAITPILVGGFGNFLVPLLIGARELAFPRLTALSFWFLVAAQACVIGSFFPELGTASTGWTMYPPLSTRVGTPGLGQTMMTVAILLVVVSTVLGGVNQVTTVIRERAPGMHFLRMPLTAWGFFLTAILNVMFAPVLGVAAGLLLLDRIAGTQFFIAGAAASPGGDPILYQHLFWIFGHPEVYILILPVWGIVGDLVAFFSRKPAFFYKGTVWALCAITTLSGLVYAHHMFTTGLGPMLGRSFMALTLLISLPAEVMFLNWMLTLWRGSIRLDSPMLFALGTMFVFGVGGLTGLYLGAIATDIYLHDTMFVVGHFHLTMAAATFLGSFAAVYFWFPKMFGRQMHEGLAKAHFWTSVIGLTLVFGGQLVAGYAGQQRRLYDPYAYDFLKRLLPLNQWTSYFAFALAAGQLLFVVNFLWSIVKGRVAEQNPWEVGTLEWTTVASADEVDLDAAPPTVLRGPHELSNPELTPVLGRDWAGQAEVVDG